MKQPRRDANVMGTIETEQRMQAAARYREIDTRRDDPLTRLTDLAARLLRTPIALVTLVDHERVWLKARHGIDVASVPLEPGLCASCVLQDDPWIIQDAASDPRTLANSLVTGKLGVRSYFGVPLRTPDLCNIGALCVLDFEPRQPSNTDIAHLQDLAAVAMHTLELRLAAEAANRKHSSELGRREQREARIGVLMQELAHRSKNLLAVVQAIARQTAGSTPSVRQYADRLTQRIKALADTHELMAVEDWFGTSMHQLIKRQLSPFTDGDHAQVTLTGPSLYVNGRAAQNIGLAIHELASNAIKYGALSIPAGSIQITWKVEGDNPVSSRLLLSWSEQGGPPRPQDTAPGFGSRVLTHLTPAALEGSAQFALSDQGALWRLDVPSASSIR